MVMTADRVRGLALPYLRAWRLKKVVSQGELLGRTGMARSSLARAEKGDQVVSFASIQLLASALGISPDELVYSDPGADSSDRLDLA